MRKIGMGPLLALGAAGGLLAWSWQRELAVTQYTLPLPAGLVRYAGLRVAQISDVHSAGLESPLAAALKGARPHMIVFTGDLVNREDRRFDRALSLAAMAAGVAPAYFVPGNHEADNPCYPRLRGGLLEAGVGVLEDQAVQVPYGAERVNLIGAADVIFGDREPAQGRRELPCKVNSLCRNGTLNLLISHRPAMLDTYRRCGVQGVFCGHAHGGQVRLPLLGPVYTPDEGMWPRVTQGVHWAGQVPVVVSRGLGNGTPAPRLWNGPELVVTTFFPGKDGPSR